MGEVAKPTPKGLYIDKYIAGRSKWSILGGVAGDVRVVVMEDSDDEDEEEKEDEESEGDEEDDEESDD